MQKKIFLFIPALFFVCVSLSSCKKYLRAKSDQTLSTPESLSDLQAILDYVSINNRGTCFNAMGADEYYFDFADWDGLDEFRKLSYVWDPGIDNIADWTSQYTSNFYANTVLYNLPLLVSNGEGEMANAIRGQALFYRAYAFFNVAQLYAPQYNSSSASSDLGIPLRLTADFNVPSSRATVKETYERIIQDVEEALPLLPITQSVKTRPSKQACHAFLSRVFLQMGDYDQAKKHSIVSLQINNFLLDFKNHPTDVDTTSSAPIKLLNAEVIFHSSNDFGSNSYSIARIDSVLFQSYEPTDLRKTVFFSANGNGSYRFKGSYSGGSINLFNGLANDEIYLIKAECDARQGNVVEAMEALNILLEKRHVAGYIPLSATDPQEALLLIFKERRKELVYRGLRWNDLRRLNTEVSLQRKLVRNLNGSLYELDANEPRYTLLIPLLVLNSSNLKQNKR